LLRASVGSGAGSPILWGAWNAAASSAGKKSGNDNRGAVVQLTGEGARTFRAYSSPHLRLIRQPFVDALSPEDLEALGRVAKKLRDHLEEASIQQ
jgi:hypothetical protein